MVEHVSMIGKYVLLACAVCAMHEAAAETMAEPARKAPAIDAGGPAATLPKAPVAAGQRQDPALPYDPLRPPASLLAPHEGSEEKQEPALQLESVQTTGSRRVAVISGQRVMPGQRVRDYRVISLDNRQAVLQGPQGRLVLWLVPALHGQAQSSAARADTVKKDSAGVSETTAPSIGERK